MISTHDLETLLRQARPCAFRMAYTDTPESAGDWAGRYALELSTADVIAYQDVHEVKRLLESYAVPVNYPAVNEEYGSFLGDLRQGHGGILADPEGHRRQMFI